MNTPLNSSPIAVCSRASNFLTGLRLMFSSNSELDNSFLRGFRLYISFFSELKQSYQGWVPVNWGHQGPQGPIDWWFDFPKGTIWLGWGTLRWKCLSRCWAPCCTRAKALSRLFQWWIWTAGPSGCSYIDDTLNYEKITDHPLSFRVIQDLQRVLVDESFFL